MAKVREIFPSYGKKGKKERKRKPLEATIVVARERGIDENKTAVENIEEWEKEKLPNLICLWEQRKLTLSSASSSISCNWIFN
jgi:hypothetical protein